MTYTNWYPGQPDGDLGVQPFSDINWDGNGQWDNDAPQATHYAVCESNQIQETVTTTTTKPSGGTSFVNNKL